eukprot:s2054_g4.t1
MRASYVGCCFALLLGSSHSSRRLEPPGGLDGRGPRPPGGTVRARWRLRRGEASAAHPWRKQPGRRFVGLRRHLRLLGPQGDGRGAGGPVSWLNDCRASLFQTERCSHR